LTGLTGFKIKYLITIIFIKKPGNHEIVFECFYIKIIFFLHSWIPYISSIFIFFFLMLYKVNPVNPVRYKSFNVF